MLTLTIHADIIVGSEVVWGSFDSIFHIENENFSQIFVYKQQYQAIYRTG